MKRRAGVRSQTERRAMIGDGWFTDSMKGKKEKERTQQVRL